MNINAVIEELKTTYPNRKIILNSKNNLTEILCEVEPASLHPDRSVAVAVIDMAAPHYHKKTHETYEVMKGSLVITIDGKETNLLPGQKLDIPPGAVHTATGNETWVRVTSKPGWTPSDHLIPPVENEP